MRNEKGSLKENCKTDLIPRRTTMARLDRAHWWPAGCAWCVSTRPCALTHARALACFARVALFLVSRASSNLYSSPQSSQNAIFANKTRRFSLKAQKSRNVGKIA